MFDYMGAFLFRSGFAHVDNVITKRGSKTITKLLLSRLLGNKPHRNSAEPSETLELSGTLRNLPEVASGTYTSTQWNPPEHSQSCLRNLHQHTPEPSRTFGNLPPEPTPAQTGTLRNLLEPSSGTCSSDPHRHTPKLIWAEDPVSLRCWGKRSRNRFLKNREISRHDMSNASRCPPVFWFSKVRIETGRHRPVRRLPRSLEILWRGTQHLREPENVKRK